MAMDYREVVAKQRERHERWIEEGLPRVVERLKEFGAVKIVLFGSRARGRTRASSDVDLLVVMPSELPFVERLAELYRKLLPGFAIDIFPYTPEEFEKGNRLIRQALKKGKVIYERGE